MAIIKLTKDNFEQEVLKSEKPVLVDFYADWCDHARCFLRSWTKWLRKEMTSKSERLMWTSRWNWHRNMES